MSAGRKTTGHAARGNWPPARGRRRPSDTRRWKFNAVAGQLETRPNRVGQIRRLSVGATVLLLNGGQRRKITPEGTTKWNLKQFQNCSKTVFHTVLKLYLCICFSQNETFGPYNIFSCFSQSRSASAVIWAPNQRRGKGGAITYAWRRRSQCLVVARYCNTLLFGVTAGVTRYALLKLTLWVTSYFVPKLITHMVSIFIE